MSTSSSETSVVSLREPDWVERLGTGSPHREESLAELHALLLRGAHAEANRRRGSLPDAVQADLDDLCQQAADDALTAVVAKLATFRGESRFTTWAYKFVIFEISTRLRRHAWRGLRVELDEAAWERMAAPGATAHERREQLDVLHLLRDGVAQRLSERQRLVFQAAVLREVPIDVLAERLSSTRGAVYKTLHDARRKLREHLCEAGYEEYAR